MAELDDYKAQQLHRARQLKERIRLNAKNNGDDDLLKLMDGVADDVIARITEILDAPEYKQ